jgi:hypothetical protein
MQSAACSVDRVNGKFNRGYSMNKVGIVSFPRYFNYGTYLQLYAMQETVSRLGYEPEIIDYDPCNDSGSRERTVPDDQGTIARIRARLVSEAGQRLAGLARRLSSSDWEYYRQDRNLAFQDFLDTSLALGSVNYFSEGELFETPPTCDAFIAGSDQIWHPVAHHEDSVYYLAFADQQKRIAYAPSFGVSEIPAGCQDWMGAQIRDIPHLSVREEAGIALVKELTGRHAQLVLDPVFLPEVRQWETFGRSLGAARPPYLLCYFLESDRYMRERALAIAEQLGLQPFMLPVHPSDAGCADNGFRRLTGVGPREFVDLVRNAAFVCTDSFHGTAFSIIFNRPFFTFRRYDNLYQAANHSRINSILRLTALQHRIRGLADTVDSAEGETDFSLANRRIADMRQGSLTFLGDALCSAMQNPRNKPSPRVVASAF